MNKTKLLTILVGLLILLNIATLAFVSFGDRDRKGPPPRHEQGTPPGPGKHGDPFIKEMEFTKQQLVEFNDIKARHVKKNGKINTDMRAQYQAYYALLKSAVIDADLSQVTLDSIIQLHEKMAVSNFDHFVEIKNLCSPEQMSKFNILIDEVGKQFSADSKPPPRNR